MTNTPRPHTHTQVLVVASAPATFVVSATTLSRELLNGVVTTGTVPAGGGALYFTFDAGASATAVQLSLGSLAGDAVAYVSSTTAQPNASNYQHVLGGVGGANVLSLNPTADQCVSATGSASSASSCFYFIAVSSSNPGSAAVFRLQATSSIVVQLTRGQMTPGIANPDSFVYYSIDVPAGATDGLSFIAQALSGGFLALYVTNAISPTTGLPLLPQPKCVPDGPLHAASCDYTTVEGVRWGSVGVTSRARLTIPGTSPWWAPGTYILAVTAAYPGTEFMVTPRLGSDPVTLAAGSPITDVAGAPNTTLTYRVFVSPNTSVVTLQAFPFSGDIVMYVCADAAIDGSPSPQTFFNAQVRVGRVRRVRAHTHRAHARAPAPAGC